MLKVIKCFLVFLHKDKMRSPFLEGLLIPEIESIIWKRATALQHLSSFRTVRADVRLDYIMVVDRRQQPFRVPLLGFGLLFQIRDCAFFSELQPAELQKCCRASIPRR